MLYFNREIEEDGKGGYMSAKRGTRGDEPNESSTHNETNYSKRSRNGFEGRNEMVSNYFKFGFKESESNTLRTSESSKDDNNLNCEQMCQWNLKTQLKTPRASLDFIKTFIVSPGL